MFDFTSFPELTTKRLLLRRLTDDDAENMMTLFGDDRVLTYSNQPRRDTPEKARELIRWLNDFYAAKTAVRWAITLRDSGRFIGECGFHDWDRDNRKVDVGYHIIHDLWGQGYATEAANAVISWVFENLGVHRVQADCTAGHAASERVLLKCGFTFEGVWRESCWEHERFVDIKQFGLLRREYTGS